MTAKLINDLQTISIRPQNDTEVIILQNLSALLMSGKKPKISFDGNDMVLEIKSEK